MDQGGGSVFSSVLYGLIFIAYIAGMWKIFEKAGKPGWAALIPIYNFYIYLQIINKPAWWLVLFLIPLVNIVILVIMSMELAVCFGKSKGWGVVLLVLFGFVGYPLLGFGDASYSKPAGA